MYSFIWCTKNLDQILVNFLEKPMDYKWVILLKLGHFENVELNVTFDRVLSERLNIKNISIGQTEHKLWLFKNS